MSALKTKTQEKLLTRVKGGNSGTQVIPAPLVI